MKPPLKPMDRALELARGVLGTTSPNPAVGAVLVVNGHIAGEGATEPPGGRHAEVVALEQAGFAARGATLYVTLEPCCTQGRTGPCTRAIIDAGVKEAHLATLDPDVNVNGRGRDQLEEAGVRTYTGEGRRSALRLNEAYVKQRTTGLPFVIAKFAASLDGKIAAQSGESRDLSGPEAHAWLHRRRGEIDAIMAGCGTVLADDPELTARDANHRPAGRQPLRIVADSRGRTPREAKVLREGARTLLATTDASPRSWREEMLAAGAEVLVFPADASGRVDLPSLLRLAGERGILSLLVEGGGVLLGEFFDRGLVDRVEAVVSPMIIGGAAYTAVAGRGALRMSEVLRLHETTVDRLGADALVCGYVRKPFWADERD